MPISVPIKYIDIEPINIKLHQFIAKLKVFCAAKNLDLFIDTYEFLDNYLIGLHDMLNTLAETDTGNINELFRFLTVNDDLYKEYLSFTSLYLSTSDMVSFHW